MCVLLVEDETIILMDVTEALERAGHEVLPVNDGRKALDAIKQHKGKFSALVTDQRIPGGIDGSAIAAAMRADYPEIPVIIATGNPADISHEFRSRYGVNVVAKPYLATAIVRSLPEPRR